MKINYFFRRSRKGFNSIEELFQGIISEIKTKCYTNEISMPLSGAYPWILIINILYVWRKKNNINHVTGDVQYLGIGLGNNTVLTVHDIYSAVNGSWLKRKYIYFFWFYWPAKKVRYITTISENSRKDLIKLVPFAKDKIRVIYNPYKKYLISKKREEVKPRFRFPARVLVIGTKPNKNLERIIPALKDLNIHLTILGKISLEQADLLGDNEIQFDDHFNLTYDEVIELYLNTHILCFPSLYEGFGMPIIEAQALGVPVITSDIGAMKEVAAESCCLVNPRETEEIRNAIIRIMQHPEYREFLIDRGFENIKRFDPERIAGQYLELYREIEGGGR